MSKKGQRLFEQFQPEHYVLDLKPDKKAMTFSGKVEITGKKIGRPSERLIFHQKGLKISAAVLVKHDKKGAAEVTIDRVNHHDSFEELRLHAKEKLYPGSYTITLEFSGSITTIMQGIYPCFFEHDGKEKIILASQFESNHAREVFPCVDEPEAKAIFDLTMTTPAGETVLSNTPVKKQSAKNNQHITTFETTPRMSTYLLAFVVGEMHAVERKTKDGVLVRSWSSVARPKNHLDYSADEAVKALEFFSDYFGVPYPLEKCDQVALPDFDVGAMENWGLVTYREIAMLADPVNRSISSEQYVTLVIAHELSHQWFGNLVTMKWWDDLWLNESFAGLMEHVASDVLHPDWNQWELYTMSDIVAISSRDVYSNIQPVGVKVTDPDLIETLFDPGIVYAKGARLLKMLREYIGDDAFVQGLRDYFKKHAFSNATREDLWAALSQSSGKDIAALMTPWLTQSGMPIVHVTQKKNSLRLKQERFLLDAKSGDRVWPIPLLASQATSPDIFSVEEAAAQTESPEFILINKYASGDYFTHYTEDAHRKYLAGSLHETSIPTEARINILNDMYMLARRGDAPLTDALDLIIKCSTEPRDGVWGAIGRIMFAATHLTEGDAVCETQTRALNVKLARNQYMKLGWDDKPNDDPNTKQLRHTMVAHMVGGEDASAIEEALRRYEKAKSLQDIDAELRSIVLSAAVRFSKIGQKEIIDKLMEAYSDESPDIQMDITGALASTKDKKLASYILAHALGDKGFVRPQDILRWLAHFLRNHYIRDIAWQFMVKEWGWIGKVLEGSKSFDFLPTYAAGIITTEEGAKKYHDFFESKKHIKVLSQNIEVGYADIKARVAWRKRDEPFIKEWLMANVVKN